MTVVIWLADSHKQINEYMEKYLSIHSFSFSEQSILEREHLRQSE